MADTPDSPEEAFVAKLKEELNKAEYKGWEDDDKWKLLNCMPKIHVGTEQSNVLFVGFAPSPGPEVAPDPDRHLQWNGFRSIKDGSGYAHTLLQISNKMNENGLGELDDYSHTDLLPWWKDKSGGGCAPNKLGYSFKRKKVKCECGNKTKRGTPKKQGQCDDCVAEAEVKYFNEWMQTLPVKYCKKWIQLVVSKLTPRVIVCIDLGVAYLVAKFLGGEAYRQSVTDKFIVPPQRFIFEEHPICLFTIMRVGRVPPEVLHTVCTDLFDVLDSNIQDLFPDDWLESPLYIHNVDDALALEKKEATEKEATEKDTHWVIRNQRGLRPNLRALLTKLGFLAHCEEGDIDGTILTGTALNRLDLCSEMDKLAKSLDRSVKI